MCFRVGSGWQFGLLVSPVAMAMQSVVINDPPAAVPKLLAAAPGRCRRLPTHPGRRTKGALTGVDDQVVLPIEGPGPETLRGRTEEGQRTGSRGEPWSFGCWAP